VLYFVRHNVFEQEYACAQDSEAICAKALPKFRRTAGSCHSAAGGQTLDIGIGKPEAPDESKAGHIHPEMPTRGLAGRHEEGRAIMKIAYSRWLVAFYGFGILCKSQIQNIVKSWKH